MRGELHGERAAAPSCNEWRAGSRDAGTSMNRNAKFGFEPSRTAVWAAGMIIVMALCVGLLHRAAATSRGSHRGDARSNLPASGGPATSVSNHHSEIRNYFMDFDGDHSLEVATVIEQPSAGYTKYTVRLRLASGTEQSVEVSAPPGGLQVEMHDMTGDKVPNDVVLRPALARWLPTVLVNDGHEHFDVAISGTDPSTFSSNEDLGSRSGDPQTFALLISSGFKAVHLPNSRRLFDQQLQECPFSFINQTVSDRLCHASSSGRAPPLITAI